MAQREGQGLQIAVICFAMLTIILAITTYIFYAQSATSSKDLEANRKSLAEQQLQNNKLMHRVLAMKHALGVGDVTAADIVRGKKEPREVLKPAARGVDVTPRIKTLKVAEPPKRSAGVKVPDVATLVAKLKNEAKVI